MAQQAGFVHIQSETGQPFYVQWNGYTYSSSGSGYMVIPKMPLGEQLMVIGFSRNQLPEQLFRYTLSDKPLAFSLKLNIDNSWSLFDMVSFTVIKGKSLTPFEKQELSREIERRGRTSLPADPQENVFKVVELKDSTGIYKIFDKTTEEGTDLVYVVKNNGVVDTVVIFIPVEPAVPPKTGNTGFIPFQDQDKDRSIPVLREPLVIQLPGRRQPLYTN